MHQNKEGIFCIFLQIVIFSTGNITSWVSLSLPFSIHALARNSVIEHDGNQNSQHYYIYCKHIIVFIKSVRESNHHESSSGQNIDQKRLLFYNADNFGPFTSDCYHIVIILLNNLRGFFLSKQ